MSNIILFAGNAYPILAQQVAQHLNVSLGKSRVTQFSDAETRVEILENVRGKDVFIVQPTSSPANHHVMELILMIDAIHRASARRITAVIPYFGYARQDKRIGSAKVPISAKVIADLLTAVGVDHVLTVDLHAEQIQGFFSVPVDNLYGANLFLEDMRTHLDQDIVVVSPDVGGVARARIIAKQLNHADLAIIDKRRLAPNKAHVMNIVGNVKHKCCLIIDDMIDTGGTICLSAAALEKAGAKKIMAYCTHPVLSGEAIDEVEHSSLEELVVTDTIALSAKALSCTKIRQLSIAPLIAAGIRHIYQEN